MIALALLVALLVARRTPGHRPAVLMLSAVLLLHAAALAARLLELFAPARDLPLLLVPAASAAGVSLIFGRPGVGALGAAASAVLALGFGSAGWAPALAAAACAEVYAWGAWSGGGRTPGPAQEVARVSAATDAVALAAGLLIGWERLAPWARLGTGAVVVVQVVWLVRVGRGGEQRGVK